MRATTHTSSATLAVAATMALMGCSAPKTPFATGGYCAPPLALDMAARLPASPAPPPGGSREETMASLLGLSDALDGAKHDLETQLVILERIQRARLAIASTSAELQCEARRAGQAADALSLRQDGTVQAFTLGSIGAATATGLATVLAATSNATAWTQNGIAIGGGVVTAGLGVTALYVNPTMTFDHPRNLLADIWVGPAESSMYPPVVWGYFTRTELSNDQAKPIRVRLVERWSHFVDGDAQRAALMFGSGGRYDVAALRHREMMLDEASSEVELVNQELVRLMTYAHPRR